MSAHLYEHLVKTKVRMKNPDYQLSDETIDLLLSAVRLAIVAFLKDVKPTSPSQALKLLTAEEEFQEAVVYALEPIMDLDWNVPFITIEEITRSIIQTYGELLAMDNFDGMRALIGAIQAPSLRLESTADFLSNRGYRWRYVEDGVEFHTINSKRRKPEVHEVRSIGEARRVISSLAA